MPLIISEDLLDTALENAQSVGLPGGLTTKGLNAPLKEQQTSWTERLWDTAEGAVRTSWEKGKAAARELLDQFHREVEELGAAVGAGASAVRKVIVERLNRFFTSLVEGALERFQPNITVAGRNIVMRGVTIEQTLKMSGSLKASLEEMCEFVAEGEISVSAEYGPG